MKIADMMSATGLWNRLEPVGKTGQANIVKVSMFKRSAARRLVRYHSLIWTAYVEDSELAIWTTPCGVFEAQSKHILSRGQRAKMSANVS